MFVLNKIKIGTFVVILVIMVITAISLMTTRGKTNALYDGGQFTYISDEHGYQFTHPQSWYLDISPTGSTGIAAYAPNKDAEVFIVIRDDAFTAFGNPEDVFRGIRTELKEQAGHDVKKFNVFDTNTYTASGTFDNHDSIWKFQEIGWIHDDGRLYIVRANVLKRSWSKHGEAVDYMFDHFRLPNISELGQECGEDSDCKLLYSNCGCGAVSASDPREDLDDENEVEIQCDVNDCMREGTKAVCLRGLCEEYIVDFYSTLQ